MQENTNFKTNTFKKRINRFKNPTFVNEEYHSFNFNNVLKSDNFEDLEFTNYVSSNECNKYLYLLDICKKIKHNIQNWNNLFIADELDLTEPKPKIKRLNNILLRVNSREINKDEVIIKFKNLQDKQIQFYVKNESKELKLYLIDIYHIAIEGEDKKTHRIDRKGIYKAMKKHKYDIIEIQKIIEKM